MSTSSTIADSSAPSANHTIIRVGLIGVGNWALNGPVRVLSLMPQYEMAAVYSQRRDAAQSAADTFGIRHVVGSIDELVRHPDVDIVLVLTTGPQHEEAVRAAIAAGKTVYCEWPLTPDSKTSAELVDLAAKAGVQTILGTQRRFAPGLRYLKDLLGDGYVGRVRSVRMHVTVSSFGKNRSKALRWSAFPENFMGVTSIFGAHLMDPLFSIVGRPTEILGRFCQPVAGNHNRRNGRGDQHEGSGSIAAARHPRKRSRVRRSYRGREASWHRRSDRYHG